MIKQLSFLAIALLFTSCSGHNREARPTGFLGDITAYRQLEYNPRTGLKRWELKPGIVGKYDSFSVDQVVIYNGEGIPVHNKYGNEVERLGQSFREKLIHALGDSYSQLPTPSRRKAIIKVALVDVISNSALRNLRPGVLIGKEGLGGASMEAEIIDSVSGKRIVAVMDSRQGRQGDYWAGLKKWDSTEDAFDYWATALKRAIKDSKRGNPALGYSGRSTY